jgi:glycosyltransferase involved in cell wall biosynthesis
MRRARVLALPSIRAKSGDREGLGIVLCEAFALGLPTVAFDSGGIRDAIREGCGLLAAEGDSQDLARQLTLLLSNDRLRGNVAANARRHAVQNFDLAQQTEKLEQLYARIAEGEAKPRTGRTFSLVGAR